MSKTIVISEYDPTWPVRFEELRNRVLGVVSDLVLGIEHVGSTSVPGLAAKPIIDFDVVVPSNSEVTTAITRLAKLGYVHIGDLGIKGREAFENPPGEDDHHLYVCPQGSVGLRNHLAVRDHLRANRDVAVAYAELKRSLAAQYPDDIDRYVDGKTDFILRILAQSGIQASDLRSIESANRA